jgi:DNA-binding NarL/FixJ family response regulator
MAPTKILLLAEDVLFRESLGRLLDGETDLVVLGQCGTAAEALETLDRSPADLVLIEAQAAGDAANEFVTRARLAGYRGKFLLLAAGLSRQSSVKALQLGVSGIFLKSRGLETLLRAVRQVASGEAWVERDMIQALAESAEQPFTAAEQQVLEGVLDGLTNRAIAARMGVPEATVKAALRRIYRRSGVQSRAQLIRATLERTAGRG